jgi:hypothetical protein
MVKDADDEICSSLGRANMTPMITQTAMIGNPPGVS